MTKGHDKGHKGQMSDREVMKLALEALVYCEALNRDVERQKEQAVYALRQSLEQPEQSTKCVEPVGEEWTPCVKLPVVVHVRKQREGETHVSTREGITPVKQDDLIMRGVAGEEYPIGRELFERTYTFDTAPPKREWVGLTDEERKQFSQWAHIDVVRHFEELLKERNR